MCRLGTAIAIGPSCSRAAGPGESPQGLVGCPSYLFPSKGSDTRLRRTKANLCPLRDQAWFLQDYERIYTRCQTLTICKNIILPRQRTKAGYAAWFDTILVNFISERSIVAYLKPSTRWLGQSYCHGWGAFVYI